MRRLIALISVALLVLAAGQAAGAQSAPTENECRPHIEKALKELAEPAVDPATSQDEEVGDIAAPSSAEDDDVGGEVGDDDDPAEATPGEAESEESSVEMMQADAPVDETTDAAEGDDVAEQGAPEDDSGESAEEVGGEVDSVESVADAAEGESVESVEDAVGENVESAEAVEGGSVESVEVDEADSVQSAEAVEADSVESVENAAEGESVESVEDTVEGESVESAEKAADGESVESVEEAVEGESAEAEGDAPSRSRREATDEVTDEAAEDVEGADTADQAEGSDSVEGESQEGESQEGENQEGGSDEGESAEAGGDDASLEQADEAAEGESTEQPEGGEDAGSAESLETTSETAASSEEATEGDVVSAEETAGGEEQSAEETEGEQAGGEEASTEAGEADDGVASSEDAAEGDTSSEEQAAADDEAPAASDASVEEVESAEGEASSETEEAVGDEAVEVEAATELEDAVESEASAEEAEAVEEAASDEATESADAAPEDAAEEAAAEPAAAPADEEAEPTPEEELSFDVDIPENLRPREHIAQILRLDEDSVEDEMLQAKTAAATLKELKRFYDSAIKPLEILYKYRDLSNRHFGDPEIFSKPLVLFMGPWSGGKSSIINYLLDNEYKRSSLRTGAEPSPAYFNILMWGEREEVLDGTQLAADWTFSGLQKFGQGLLDRLRGLRLNNRLLEKVNIVEIPGILEIRKQVERLFPFNDACQWFIDRADIIFLVYDPAKLDVGPETEAILDQLKGREYQTRIVLNKADQVRPEELMRVQGTLIWNISPLMSSTQPPVMYSTSLWSMPYELGAPLRLLRAQERAFLRDMREAIDHRVENKIASARRFAVRVRNHAKMVDCYLTTYYNHKSFFGNRKKVADDIIDKPQDYHIYEGLSTLTNISRYDLPDPETYRDFFRVNPLYEFELLKSTCTYFKGCPINRLDVAIAYELPELVGKYKKAAEAAVAKAEPKS